MEVEKTTTTSKLPPFFKLDIIKYFRVRSSNFNQIFGFDNMELGRNDNAMERASKIKID